MCNNVYGNFVGKNITAGQIATTKTNVVVVGITKCEWVKENCTKDWWNGQVAKDDDDNDLWEINFPSSVILLVVNAVEERHSGKRNA